MRFDLPSGISFVFYRPVSHRRPKPKPAARIDHYQENHRCYAIRREEAGHKKAQKKISACAFCASWWLMMLSSILPSD